MKKITCLLLCLYITVSFFGCGKQQEAAPEIITPDVVGWTLTSEDGFDVTDGVTYLERRYVNDSQAPYQVYILLLDPKKVTLHTGTSNNDFEIIPTVRQDVLEQMKASEEDGLHVIAAVNGDFFAISSTYQPSGLSVKSGVVISPNTKGRPYSAVTKEGEFFISHGFADGIDPFSLDMAVGGSHVIVSDGKAATFEEHDDLANTSHPRTLAGVRADGTIILAVIDGRQPLLSNGATLTQCAQLMIALGAVTAINHDGGGSSTMIIHKNDTYQVMNRPSDGGLRRVYCSIQVIEK